MVGSIHLWPGVLVPSLIRKSHRRHLHGGGFLLLPDGIGVSIQGGLGYGSGDLKK